MRRLCATEELKEQLSKFSCLSDWLQTPIHEVITIHTSEQSTDKEN